MSGSSEGQTLIPKRRAWVIAVTGASGSIYAIRLIQELIKLQYPIHLLITDAGWRVIFEELNWNMEQRNALFLEKVGDASQQFVKLHSIKDIGASIASGSNRTAGMVVVPCSMGTLANIASGSSRNLLERTADVMLKENRPLILLPRETPLHAIHLENMLKLARLGVAIVPAMPAFYHQPKSMNDLIDFVVGKLLDRMGVDHQLFERWGSEHDQPIIEEPYSDRTN